MGMNQNAKNYGAHLDATKEACLADGMTASEWRSKLVQSNITLRSIGFNGGAHVRQVAVRYGIFV